MATARVPAWTHVPYEDWQRPKYFKISELISDYEASKPLVGNNAVICTRLDHLKNWPDDGTPEALTAACVAMFQDVDMGPPANSEGIIYADLLNGPEVAAKIQYYGAWFLTQMKWSDKVRAACEASLWKTRTFYSAEALQMLLDYLCANHHNAKAFLAQPEVSRHIPADADLSAASHDEALSPELLDVTIAGIAADWPPSSETK